MVGDDNRGINIPTLESLLESDECIVEDSLGDSQISLGYFDEAWAEPRLGLSVQDDNAARYESSKQKEFTWKLSEASKEYFGSIPLLEIITNESFPFGIGVLNLSMLCIPLEHLSTVQKGKEAQGDPVYAESPKYQINPAHLFDKYYHRRLKCVISSQDFVIYSSQIYFMSQVVSSKRDMREEGRYPYLAVRARKSIKYNPQLTLPSSKDTLSSSKQTNANPPPLSFYFDPKVRKQIIHQAIDLYIQPRKPPSEPHYSAPHRQKPFTQRISSQHKTMGSLRMKHQAVTERAKKDPLEQLSKTADVRFFNSKELLISSKRESLQIIEEFNETPRPQTTGKIKSYSFTDNPILSRPQTHHSFRSKYLRDNSSAQSVQYFDSLNSSLANGSFAEGPSNGRLRSRASSKSRRSVSIPLFKCKYYEYEKQNETGGVVKKFTAAGEFLYSRQLQAEVMGADVLWEKSVFQNQLTFSPGTFDKTLDQEIFYKVSREHGNETVHIIYPRESAYEGLFSNASEWLRDIVVGVCEQMIKCKGRVINNRVVMRNIFRKGEKQVFLVDWSASAIRHKITNLDQKKIIKCIEPTLQEEGNMVTDIFKWLCEPHYLAPEIVRGLSLGKVDESVLWEDDGLNSPSSDMWSLGCLIFQIFTLIPLNCWQRCSVKGRAGSRRGLLSMSRLVYSDLLKKQRNLSQQALKILKRECQDLLDKVDWRVVSVMQGMLRVDRSSRLKPEEAIRILRA